MNGANHEREADKSEGYKDAERGVGDFKGQKFSDPPLRAVKSGEGDAGHGSGKSEGKIDKRIQCPAKWKIIAGEDPGDDQSDNTVEAPGQKR